MLWLGDLERLRHDPELSFFFREEIGHDALGYPPPTIDIAVRQLGSTRRTLAHLPAGGRPRHPRSARWRSPTWAR